MAVPAITINESALLNGTSTTCAVGDVLIDDATTGLYVKATTANRGTRRSHGVALTAWAQSGVQGSVRIQTGGLIAAATTGLGAGTVSWVRVSATATLERVTPGAGDDIVGKCDVNGNLFLHVGTWDSTNYTSGAGSVPSGTGFPHITAGSQDAAAKLVEDADVHASAAIAASKVVQATGTGIPHVVAGALSAASSLIVNADVDAGAAIAISKLAAIAATDIASGTLIHERGGLEADVSAYNGLVKITGGATSAVLPAAGVETFITTPSGANLASVLTSALPVSKGGTGVTALTSFTSAITTTAKVTAGFLAFNGAVGNATTGTQNDIPRASIVRLTDGINITGIDATGAADGELVLFIIPALSAGITFLHNNGGSAAANQITTWNAGTINAYENSFVLLLYDLTATKWKFLKEGF